MHSLFSVIGAIVVIDCKLKMIMLVAVSLLTACTSSIGDSRYKDTHDLERPPAVVTEKLTPEQQEASEREAPRRRHGKGLGSDVFMVDGTDRAFKFKRSFDEAWNFLNRAIQLKELKITDQDRSKGVFYVAYNGSGFLNNATSLFKDDKDQTIYLLKVEGSGDETSVVVGLASKDEQSNSATKDKSSTEDASAKLVNLLYDTLHDDVKDE